MANVRLLTMLKKWEEILRQVSRYTTSKAHIEISHHKPFIYEPLGHDFMRNIRRVELRVL